MGGYYNVSVGSTPRRITNAFEYRSALSILNNDPNITIYLGTDASVSPVNGMPMPSQSGLNFLRGLGDETEIEYWGVTSAGTADVRVLEGYTSEPIKEA
ncbi:MAG: hypothetical protein PHW03_09415 [Eubacteriales bacterium]|nr:hypothetical protein [Eubacteriales bacterium]